MKESAKRIVAVGTNLNLGHAAVPPSKSAMNRALVLACLASGESFIWWGDEGNGGDKCSVDGRGLAEDVRLMCRGLKALGCELAVDDGGIRVFGGRRLRAVGPVDAGDAGTVLRFLLPLAALHCDGPVEFVGSKRLFERPLAPLLEALGKLGAEWRPIEGGQAGGVLAPAKGLTNDAGLGIDISIDGSLSSQFISGLAMAVAGLGKGRYKLQVTRYKKQVAGRCDNATSPAPTSFLHLTQSWLNRFGCEARLHESGIEIPAGKLMGGNHRVYGDWGAAATLFCAAAVLESEICVFPLSLDDSQPDSAILQILQEAGCAWQFNGDRCRFNGSLKRGIEANLAHCPDLAPILTTVAAFAPGASTLRGLGALPHKESDRLQGCTRLAEWLGASTDILDAADGPTLRINGKEFGTAGIAPTVPFDPLNDHRMAFGAAIGAMKLGGSILNPSCVDKSFPSFWEIIVPDR
jgi:3-phosphoshikimate 1-carboxyvinyltransferase